MFYPYIMTYATCFHVIWTAFQFWCYWSHEKGTIDSIVFGLICAFDPTILHRFSFLIDVIIMTEDIAMAYLIVNKKFEVNTTIAAIVLCTAVRTLILFSNIKLYNYLVNICKHFKLFKS